MTAIEMRNVEVSRYRNPGTCPNRVRVTTADNHQLTINGKFAGGLPAPTHQGREGIWVGYKGDIGSLVWLDGDEAPVYLRGIDFRCID